MATVIPKTAQAIFTERNDYFEANHKRWGKEAAEIGLLKERLEIETSFLKAPSLVGEITIEKLDQIKADFEDVRVRLQTTQKEIDTEVPLLKEAIRDITAAIGNQESGDLSGLDRGLQETAVRLAVATKEHLSTLSAQLAKLSILQDRFSKRLTTDTEVRWRTFCYAYAASHDILAPPPPGPGILARTVAYLRGAAAPVQ